MTDTSARTFSGFLFVNVYDVDRGYGGREEGGWWFDYGTLKKCRPCRTRAEAEKIRERFERYLDATHNAEGNHDLSSVNCQGRMVAYIEGQPGEDFPTERPRYE